MAVTMTSIRLGHGVGRRGREGAQGEIPHRWRAHRPARDRRTEALQDSDEKELRQISGLDE